MIGIAGKQGQIGNIFLPSNLLDEVGTFVRKFGEIGIWKLKLSRFASRGEEKDASDGLSTWIHQMDEISIELKLELVTSYASGIGLCFGFVIEDSPGFILILKKAVNNSKQRIAGRK